MSEGIDLTYLQTIVFILVIAALVQFVEMFLKKVHAGIIQCPWRIPSADYDKLCRSWCSTDKCYTKGIRYRLQSVVNGFATAVGFPDCDRSYGRYA